MRRRLPSALLALAAGAGAVAVAPGGDPRPASSESARDGRSPARAARAPARRPPDPAALARGITRADVAPHLRGLADAARRGGGTRVAGTAGDRASAAYVARRLRAAGWRVSREVVRFPYFAERRAPRIVPAGGRRLGPGEDARTLAYSSGGTVDAVVRVIRSGARSGCRRADFRGMRRGEVALIVRGACTLRAKARAAERAGAAAALIVNSGGVRNPARSPARSGRPASGSRSWGSARPPASSWRTPAAWPCPWTRTRSAGP